MIHRFLLDNDGSNFFGQTMRDDVEASIEEAVWECPANVTTYLLCAGSARFYFPTRVGEVAPTYQRLLRAHAEGKDPFGLFLKALRKAGKETFVTFRMNDVHNANEPDHPSVPSFRKKHPDLIVGAEAVRRGDHGWLNYCLDYSRPEVRQYLLALLREIIEGYDIDGLQLDWMRFPRHLSGTPEEVWEKRSILTEFTAEVRAMMRRSGKRRLLGARVPSSLAGCRHVGLDVAEWARRGVIDFLVAGPFLTTDFTMPLAEFRAAMGDRLVPLYASLDFGHGGQNHCPESLRGACTSLYDCGADGIYVFNFPCWTEYLAVRPYHWIGELHEPELAARKPLLLGIAYNVHRMPDVDLPGLIPAKVTMGGTLEIPLHIPPAALPLKRVIALLQSGGDVALHVNGQGAAELTELRRAELFPEFIDPAQTSQRPRWEDCRVFQPDASALKAGDNQLLIQNRSATELEIRRLNVGLW